MLVRRRVVGPARRLRRRACRCFATTSTSAGGSPGPDWTRRRLAATPSCSTPRPRPAASGRSTTRHRLRSPHRADRQAALYTLLVELLAARRCPFQYVRLALGSVLRATGYLVGQAALGRVRRACSPWLACSLRPDRILRGRAARRRPAGPPHPTVRALLPSWWTPYANGLDSLLSRFAGTVRDAAAQVAAAARRRRSGAAESTRSRPGRFPTRPSTCRPEPGPIAWMVGHPILSLATVLTAAAAPGDARPLGWRLAAGRRPAAGAGGQRRLVAELHRAVAPRRHGLTGHAVAVRRCPRSDRDDPARQVLAGDPADRRAGRAGVGDRCVRRCPAARRQSGRAGVDGGQLRLAPRADRRRLLRPSRYDRGRDGAALARPGRGADRVGREVNRLACGLRLRPRPLARCRVRARRVADGSGGGARRHRSAGAGRATHSGPVASTDRGQSCSPWRC